MSTYPPAIDPNEEREHRTLWWKEASIMGGFYLVYSLTRNQFGSSLLDGSERAFNNAMKIVRLERAIGLFHEETVQQWFLPYKWFIQLLNTYYGTAHFAVTIGIFFVLFKKRKDVFPLYRNALAAMTGLAIIGFAFFPLMPPRLLDVPCPPTPTELAALEAASVTEVDVTYGGACHDHETRNYNGATTFGFEDTLDTYGGPWDFNSGGVAKASNQYAAMPSLHIGWASWCAFGVWPLLKRRWTKVSVLLYPAFTLFCIVVTGNHFWLDGVGGLIVLGFGFLIGGYMHSWNQKRLDRKFAIARMAHPAG